MKNDHFCTLCGMKAPHDCLHKVLTPLPLLKLKASDDTRKRLLVIGAGFAHGCRDPKPCLVWVDLVALLVLDEEHFRLRQSMKET